MGLALIPAIGAAVAASTTYAVVVGLLDIILINVALGALSKALTKRPKQFAPPINVTIRNPVENRRLVFGRVRVGGSITFFGASGTNNKFLHYVVVFAGHQVNAIKDIWLDKIAILESQINGGTGEVTAGVFAGKVFIFKHLGTGAQTVDTTLDAAFSVWGTDHRLRGCAYIELQMERDDAAFPQGAPQDVTAIVDGARLYDPRLDSTNGGAGSHRRDDPQTWAFSRNSALIARWFISGGSVVNDQASVVTKYGLQEPQARIDDAYTITAANECDESLTGGNSTPDGDQVRYNCDIEVSTGETRREIMDDILATMAGRAVYVHGQWRIYAGAYDSPTHTFTEADLFTVEEAPIEVQDTTNEAERFNAVAGVYRDASNSYVEQTSPFRTNSSYETQDFVGRIPREIDLRGITDKYRAQRLCEIEMRKSRQMRQVKIRGSLNLMKVATHETFQISHTALGWTNRVFRCVEKQLEVRQEAVRVVLTAQAEDSGVYTDLATGDYITPNTVNEERQVETPDPPTALITVPQVDAILIKWTPPTTPGVTYELQYSTSSSMSSPTTIQTPDTQYYLDRTATTVYYFRVRSKKNGQTSAYEPSSGGTSGAAIGITATLSGSADGNASSVGTGASQTTNTVTVTATGGTAPYTYAWTFTSGGTGITITSNTAAATTFSAVTLADPEVRSGTARCRITDNVAATFDVFVSVYIERLSSFTASAAGTAPLSKSANSSSITSNNITATPSGGSAPYTYAWSIVSHDDPNSTPTINNNTSQTCTVTTSQAPADQLTITVTIRCVVTDNATKTATTNNVTIDHTHDNGL